MCIPFLPLCMSICTCVGCVLPHYIFSWLFNSMALLIISGWRVYLCVSVWLWVVVAWKEDANLSANKGHIYASHDEDDDVMGRRTPHRYRALYRTLLWASAIFVLLLCGQSTHQSKPDRQEGAQFWTTTRLTREQALVLHTTQFAHHHPSQMVRPIKGTSDIEFRWAGTSWAL